MLERILPIGTVVILKNAEKRLMIIGYCKHKAGDDETVYDYAGCFFPEGFISADTTALFNHEDIEHIYALGFQNDDRFAFEQPLRDAIGKIKPFN